AKVAIRRQGGMSSLKPVGAANIKKPAHVCLCHQQIIVREEDVIIVLQESGVLTEERIEPLPFRAFGVDPDRIAAPEKLRIIAKIADNEVPVALSLAAKPVRMQGFISRTHDNQIASSHLCLSGCERKKNGGVKEFRVEQSGSQACPLCPEAR